MSASHETGVLRDRLPFVRIGSGATPLVVLPGLSLTNELPGGFAAAAWARGFRALTEEHTLHIVQRPAPLAPGASTRDIAGEYASVLGPELGRFRLMGLSTGGLIAQHLALDDPSSVQRLALVVSGSRLAGRGRALCTRWLRLAEAGRWRELNGDLAAIAVDGRAVQGITRALFRLSGTVPGARQAADFTTTVAADLAHDTRSRLGTLRAPTLVLGGALDPFFPEEILRETADAVPRSELTIFPRNGHGVPKHRASAMQAAVAEFLARGDHAGPDGRG